jgi:hypothetical protein
MLDKMSNKIAVEAAERGVLQSLVKPISGELLKRSPAPKLLLHQKAGKIVSLCDLRSVPKWAKPILQTAIATDKKS